jgi:hypothetical protein
VKYIPNQLLDNTGHLLSEHRRTTKPLIKPKAVDSKDRRSSEHAEVVIHKQLPQEQVNQIAIAVKSPVVKSNLKNKDLMFDLKQKKVGFVPENSKESPLLLLDGNKH